MANLVLESNLFYYTNALTSTTSDTQSKWLGEVFAGGSIPKYYFMGWNVNLNNRSTSSAAGSTSLTTTEMGPRFGAFFGKGGIYSVALTFNPLVSATFNPPNGGGTEKWQGYGYLIELGFAPQVGKVLYAGVKIIYDVARYSSRTDAGNITSSVSYTQSSIFPSLYLSWRY